MTEDEQIREWERQEEQHDFTEAVMEINRSSIGIELNSAYVKIIRKRLSADSQLDTGVVEYKFEKV